MDIAPVSAKTSFRLIFTMTALAALSLIFVWRGGGRFLQMQTQAARGSDFAQTKPEQETKIVVEVGQSSSFHIAGKLLEKQDETHYVRTETPAEVVRSKETKLIMGNAEDIHVGAIIHVTGKVNSDHRVQAAQIVILTGYVQVR